MKLLLVGCLITLTTANEALPNGSFTPLALGFVQGFISDGSELMLCGMQLAGEGAKFKASMDDLKDGLKGMNLTQIDSSLRELADVLSAGPDVKTACEPVKADLVALKAALKQLHGPKTAIAHMLENLVEDRDKIFSELAAAEKAYKTGWDFMTAGKDLGMAFRRMLVGEMNGSSAPLTMTKGCEAEILEGMAIGFISDNFTTLDCARTMRDDAEELEKTMKDLEMALHDKNVTAIAAAVNKLADDLPQTRSAAATCKGVVEDAVAHLKVIKAALKDIHGPKDLIIHMADNLVTDGGKIFGNLQSAADEYKSKHCMAAGRKMGMAFRRSLVGEASSTPPNSTLVIV